MIESYRDLRAAVSVPANIAEGHGRGTTNAFINHLWIANGSFTELGTHLLIAQRLGSLAENELIPVLAMAKQVGRTLIALRRSLEHRST